MLHMIAGTILALEQINNECRMIVKNDAYGKVVFHITDKQFLLDHRGNACDWSAAAIGLEIAAVLSDATPMTMSLPPQISGAYGYILPNGYNIVCGCFDELMTDPSLCLQIQPGEQTRQFDLNCNVLTEIKAPLEAVVVYGRSTRSIPATTVPECMIVSTEI